MKKHFVSTQFQFEVTNLTNCCNPQGRECRGKKVNKKIRGTEHKVNFHICVSHIHHNKWQMIIITLFLHEELYKIHKKKYKNIMHERDFLCCVARHYIAQIT